MLLEYRIMCVRATTASVRDASDPSVQVTGRRVRGLGCGSGSMLRVVLAAVMDCPESLTASELVRYASGHSGGRADGDGRGWAVKHWCLIETGANQAYVFGTNRLRHVVGASYLVHQVGTDWVPEAARRVGARLVVAISGKALLLVDDPAAGQAVISEVSMRALDRAPGLEVTGVVGPGFDPELAWWPELSESLPVSGERSFTHVEALQRTYELLETARQARPSPQLRDPLLPWFEVCRDSGYPAAGLEDADGGHAAASVLAKSKVRWSARDRMRALLCDLPEVVPENLDDLRHDGWIAVIHADGNGVGQVFLRFPEHVLRADGTPGLSLDRHADMLGQFTRELESATEAALGVAVREAIASGDAEGTILPVVVGGDDLTVVCHARLALPLARAFGLAFEEQTAVKASVNAITGGGLTAAAGIAYVKPHHPFSAAYGLAEELTASAKRVKQQAEREMSSLDFHVTFESTLTDLAGLRARLEPGGITRYGGPYVITGEDSPPAGPQDIAGLDRALRTVSALSSSMAHYLREGLAAGREEYDQRISRAARSADLPPGIRPDDIESLASAVTVAGDAAEGRSGQASDQVRSTRLLDALLLSAVARPAPAAAADRPGALAGTERTR